MRRFRVVSHKLVQLILTLAIIPGGAAGQSGSAIRGAVSVLGPGDMPVSVPGVQIVLRCEKLGEKAKTTVTDETGHFSFPGLAPDRCSVTVSAQGFRGETKTVVVTENSAADLFFRLELKTVAEKASEARTKRAPAPASSESARPTTKRTGWRP
jgi:hypothetical protein